MKKNFSLLLYASSQQVFEFVMSYPDISADSQLLSVQSLFNIAPQQIQDVN